MGKFRAACVQLRSSEDVAINIQDASRLIHDAAKGGAQFVATPENTTLMATDGGAKLANSFDEANDPALAVFTALAKELGLWLLIGSLAIKVSDSKTANRSFMIGPDGKITTRYSKIHLFDVDLDGGESYRESASVLIRPGAGSGFRSVTICGSPVCIALWPKRAPLPLQCRQPLRSRPAKRIGMCCLGHALLRMAPLLSHPHRAGRTSMAAKPMAIV